MDDNQTWKMSDFAIYDINNHLIPLDSGLIESKRVNLFISGVARGVGDEKSLAILKAGPMINWSMTGFGSDEDIKVSITTECAEIWLEEASTNYKPIYQVLMEKVRATKMVYTILKAQLEANTLMDFRYNSLLEECSIQAEKYG